MLGALGMLGLPAIVLLRDLGPAPGDKLAHTVWAKGMRVVNDVAGTPIKPEEVEIGQLINAEPGVFYEEKDGEPQVRGRPPPAGQGQGRGHRRADEAQRHHPGPGP